MTTILPDTRPMLYCVTGAGDPITGTTLVGELTGVNPLLTVVADADEMAFVAALPADVFPPLPDSGWLEADTIYQHEAQAVIVRTSHWRTHYAPAETPNLFIVYREGADTVLEWAVGESVLVGTLRSYEGVTYRCVQAHVIDDPSWTPPNTLEVLWELVPDEPTGDWIDSGETVTSLLGAGVIGVTNTAPFPAGTAIRILATEATVTRVHQAGSPGVLVIDPHIAVSGGEMIEVRG